MSLPREGPPDITIPFVTIVATYQGTAPSEMEKLVTIPIEKKVKDVENVKEVSSSTSEGVAIISVEFVAGEDIDNARQQVKNKLDLARPDLPTDLDEPAVDLAVAMAMASSLLDRSLPEKAVFIGELGLGGEIRSVTNLEMRLKEAAAIGLTDIYLPFSSAKKAPKIPKLNLVPCKNIEGLLSHVFRG
jgi:predicted ATP-dependent Lon-type protease